MVSERSRSYQSDVDHNKAKSKAKNTVNHEFYTHTYIYIAAWMNNAERQKSTETNQQVKREKEELTANDN